MNDSRSEFIFVVDPAGSGFSSSPLRPTLVCFALFLRRIQFLKWWTRPTHGIGLATRTLFFAAVSTARRPD